MMMLLWRHALHWNLRVVMMPTLSSFVATTSDATNDDKSWQLSVFSVTVMNQSLNQYDSQILDIDLDLLMSDAKYAAACRNDKSLLEAD